jgi:hypothetical protein
MKTAWLDEAWVSWQVNEKCKAIVAAPYNLGKTSPEKKLLG